MGRDISSISTALKAVYRCDIGGIELIFQFHALLEGSSPRVWRRFLIDADDTAADLMNDLMIMFQMDGYHLFHLEEYVPGMPYASSKRICTKQQIEATEDFDYWGVESLPAEDCHIKDIVGKQGDQMRFFYDYGDDWTLRLKLEAVLCDDDYEGQLPCVIKGKGAGIIEDCGGVWALNDMMQEEKELGPADDEDSLLLFDKNAINMEL